MSKSSNIIKARKRRPAPKNFNDNPPLTAAELAKMRPAHEVVPNLVEAFKRSRGRPKVDRPKVPLSIRIDPDVLDAFKATGEGWQGRMQDALTKAAKRIKVA